MSLPTDIEFTFKCVDPGDYKTPSKWKVTIKRGSTSYTTDYSMGAAHRVYNDPRERATYGKPVKLPYNGKMTIHEQEQLEKSKPVDPDLKNVLYCLWSDAQSVSDGQSFEDWCADFGYDTDSRKAHKAYKACLKTYQALKRLGFDFEELAEFFQDY